MIFSFELKEYMTTEECFQALEEGAVDAVVQGSLVGMDDYKIICRFGAQPILSDGRKAEAKGNGGCRLCAWRDHSGLSDIFK